MIAVLMTQRNRIVRTTSEQTVRSSAYRAPHKCADHGSSFKLTSTGPDEVNYDANVELGY